MGIGYSALLGFLSRKGRFDRGLFFGSIFDFFADPVGGCAQTANVIREPVERFRGHYRLEFARSLVSGLKMMADFGDNP